MLIAAGTVLGFGERRKIVIYGNYDDLFLTFTVPVLAFAALFGVSSDKLLFTLLGFTAALASVGIFGFTVWRTFKANERSLWKTALAIVTKFPLAFLWVMQIISLISPAGKTGLQRAQNRATALLILTILTPIIAALVVERTGYFSPRGVLKGKRIGAIRDHL